MDEQARIQRLWEAVDATVGLHPQWATCVLRDDLAALLAAHAALVERVRALEYAATWVNETFDDDNDTARSYEQRTSLDHLRITLSGQDYMNAQQPPAASPATTDAGEGGA